MDSNQFNRRDLENRLFERWSISDQADQELVESHLRRVLEDHAKAVMYSILRRADTTILAESVDRVMMNLPSFRKESLFTTWAHRVMMGVFYDYRRLERHRREISLDIPGFDLPSSPEATDLLLTVEAILGNEEHLLFRELVLLGKSQQEAAVTLGIPQQTLSRKWEKTTRKLSHAFAK